MVLAFSSDTATAEPVALLEGLPFALPIVVYRSTWRGSTPTAVCCDVPLWTEK